MRSGPAQRRRRVASVSKIWGPIGVEAAEPWAVDASVDEVDRLAGVEEEG